MSAKTPELATVPQQPFPTRAALFVGAAVVLWFALALLYRASPSERFHLIVVFVWGLDFALFRARQIRMKWGLVVCVGIGSYIGLWCFLMQRANMLEGRVAPQEPLWWMLFIFSLFVLYHWLCMLLTRLLNLIPKAGELLESSRGWWLRVLRMGIAIVLFTPYLFAACNIHRFKVANATDPKRAIGLSYEVVTFPATDGIPLQGWYIPAKGARATVLICHGISANKANFLAFAPFLHEAGFNVFIFDQRGHGDSPGHTVSIGFYEARDVHGAVNYLRSRPDTRNILGYGFSMGGSSLLHAMPDLPMIRGVVIDSTYADLTLLGYDQVAFLPAPLAGALMKSTAFWTQVELGVPLSAISPRRHIGVVSPRPLLLIHGAADSMIPPSHAELNFAAAGQPKALWLVPGANHIQSMWAQEREYQRRVVAHFRKCLNPPTENLP